MNIKNLLILAVISLASSSIYAETTEDKTPEKNDVTVAVTLGYNSYTGLKAVQGYSYESHELLAVPSNWNDKKLMVGFEFGWFFADEWKASIGGGFNFSSNPGYGGVPSINDDDTSLPGYAEIPAEDAVQFTSVLGIDRYFKTSVNGLLPYVGIRAGFSYGHNTARWEDKGSLMNGKSEAESFDIRGAFTLGVDYFITNAFYVGAQVDAASYTYTMSTLRPMEAIDSRSADCHNVSALSAPTLKVGFKF